MKDVPARVGRYFVTGHVADGGMGQVLRGELREGNVVTPIAIKIVRTGQSSAGDLMEHLQREAAIGVLLKHPNIVSTREVGLDDDGRIFIAMEFIEGVSLAQLFCTGTEQSAPDIMFWIGAEVCAALEYIHTFLSDDGEPLHLVHRDISPQNVMISSTGEVKLIDFGIAKADEMLGPRTATGVLKGKIRYMSPEQAHGNKLDARSDLFSLGAVLFEGIAGRQLYREANDLKALMAAQQGAVSKELATLLETLKSDQFQALRKSLRTSTAARFHSAQEMGTSLVEAIDDIETAPRRVVELVAAAMKVAQDLQIDARAGSHAQTTPLSLEGRGRKSAADEKAADSSLNRYRETTSAITRRNKLERPQDAFDERGPLTKAGWAIDNLNQMRLLGDDVLVDVRKSMDQDALVILDNARRGSWIPLYCAVASIAALEQRVGEVELLRWTQAAFLQNVEGRVLSPIVSVAVRLFGRRADKLFNVVPRTFSMLYRNAGSLALQKKTEQSFEMIWNDCPQMVIDFDVWQTGSIGTYRGLLEVGGFIGEIDLEIERERRRVRFPVSWQHR